MIPTFIPCGDIPKNWFAFGTERELPKAHVPLEWFDADTPELYRKNGGHAVFSEHDVTYVLNSYGYRCPEFDVEAPIKVISVGCSHVFGTALPLHMVFPERFCTRLRESLGIDVVHWNLSTCGGSNDFISRMVFLALPKLRPDIVLVNFTYPMRRDYVSVDNRWFKYLPSCRFKGWCLEEIHDHFLALGNPNDDALNLYRNYKAVEAACHNVMWLCSFTDASHVAPIRDHISDANHVGFLEYVDTARDNGHAGPRSHENLADRYWNRLLELGWKDRLAAHSSKT